MKNDRKLRMTLTLPILIIPFLTLGFWALGGGKGSETSKISKDAGLNLQLPNPKLKEEKAVDKLSFYDRAQKDSEKLWEAMRNDPYYKDREVNEASSPLELETITETRASKYNPRLNVSPDMQSGPSPEQKVLDKLAFLQKQLNQPPSNSKEPRKWPENSEQETRSPLSGDVDRLENLMEMASSGNSDDPQIRQLSSVMDKILDVQHPERIKSKMLQQAIKREQNAAQISSEAPGDTAVDGFYGFSQEKHPETFNAVSAVVNEQQVLVNGGVIKFRLTEDLYVNAYKIPKGNFVYGIVNLNGERLEVKVESIKCQNNLFDVSLEVVDQDGLSGIYIPGAISREVAKQSADNSLQLMELSALNPSLKAQATTAGVNSIKNLLSRKVKQVKVTVKAGYNVLLKNKSTKS